MSEEEPTKPEEVRCKCGYIEGTFACKIRHINMNTGWAKSAND